MPQDSAYLPVRTARTRSVPLRGLHYQLHEWGDVGSVTPETPALVFAHGWMDVGASFQFIVDELARLEGERRYVVAFDWRGFGGSSSGGADAFWFPDYLGDLEALLDILAPELSVDLAGHSMGGNVAMSYAGVRPGRIRRLVNLEGFGMPDAPAERSPDRLAKWLDELKTPASLRPYATLEDVARRLMKNNPRLPTARAHWLAPHWAAQRADGQWHILGDPAHKRVNPMLYRAAEILAAWRRIEAPMLWLEGAQTDVGRFWGTGYPREEFESRLAQVRAVQRLVLQDCGHMLHHDQPAACAKAIRAFLD
ncbi:MAG TPA: alpha/beta hydrolase [Burkholderiaceae bacterium]|jgi:pimeloyl-ACP methyl ester carboxylesterase|nr:alpha/beta hydrolase [Burkholderiaceae bacterium]